MIEQKTSTVISRRVLKPGEYEDDNDDMQADLDEYYAIPTAHEQAQKHRELFALHNSDKAVEEKEFIKIIKKKDFDAPPYYLKTIYAQYAKDPRLTRLFNDWFEDGKTSNKDLDDALLFANKPAYKDNLIIFLHSPKRLGKSTLARAIARRGNVVTGCNARWHMDPANLDDGREQILDEKLKGITDDYEAYNNSDIKKIVPRMRETNWLIKDEDPEERAEGSNRIKKDTSNLFKVVSGKRRLNIIVLNQFYEFINGVQLIIQVVATDRVNWRTLAIVKTQDERGNLETQGLIVYDVSKEPAWLREWYRRRTMPRRKSCRCTRARRCSRSTCST